MFTVGGALQDTLLMLPRLLAVGSNQFYVFDYGDSRVKAFDIRGRPLWSFGSPGEGPGEFKSPFDLEVAPDGSVWILDGGTVRITVLSSDGQLSRLVPLHGRAYRDVLPLRNETLATPISPENVAWVAISDSGDEVARGPYFSDELRSAHFGVRWTVAATSPDGNTWAAVFPLGNKLLIYDGREVRCEGTLVEGDPLPNAAGAEQPTIWASALFFSDSSLMVLPRGKTEGALRMLDEYSLADCTYVRTLELPGKVVGAAALGGIYVLAQENPVPRLLGIRRR